MLEIEDIEEAEVGLRREERRRQAQVTGAIRADTKDDDECTWSGKIDEPARAAKDGADHSDPSRRPPLCRLDRHGCCRPSLGRIRHFEPGVSVCVAVGGIWRRLHVSAGSGLR